jgi:hypothetical protein
MHKIQRDISGKEAMQETGNKSYTTFRTFLEFLYEKKNADATIENKNNISRK